MLIKDDFKHSWKLSYNEMKLKMWETNDYSKLNLKYTFGMVLIFV